MKKPKKKKPEEALDIFQNIIKASVNDIAQIKKKYLGKKVIHKKTQEILEVKEVFNDKIFLVIPNDFANENVGITEPYSMFLKNYDILPDNGNIQQ